jgi:hypothetical protein
LNNICKIIRYQYGVNLINIQKIQSILGLFIDSIKLNKQKVLYEF